MAAVLMRGKKTEVDITDCSS